MREYPGPRPHARADSHAIMVELHLAAGPEEPALRFFSTVTTFGTAADVTVSELSVEAFFPADAATATRLRRCGGELDTTAPPQRGAVCEPPGPPMRMLAAAPRALTPLALLAAALALLVPSRTLAGHSDLVLALLVLATALGIPAAELRSLRRHRVAVTILSVVPLLVLTGVAWVIGQAFDRDVRDGLLAVGLSSSEVATVGLVALAGADATIALGAVTGSLILAALAGPLLIGLLAGSSGHGGGDRRPGRPLRARGHPPPGGRGRRSHAAPGAGRAR